MNDLHHERHLEFWTTRKGNRALGLEFGHPDIANIWITNLNIPPSLPGSVKVTRKTPIGSKWTDANDDGANSNQNSFIPISFENKNRPH